MLDEHLTAQDAELVRRLLAWAEPKIDYIYWGSGQLPSATLVFQAPEGRIQPCSVYLSSSGEAGIAVNLEWMRRRPPAAIDLVVDKLTAIPRIAEQRADIIANNYAKRPSIPLTELGEHGIDELTGALDTLLSHPTES